MELASGSVALIAIALSSAKIVYQAVSEIRHGPSIVKQAALALLDLSSALEQLQGRVEGGQFSEWDLDFLLRRCHYDLELFKLKIQNLRPQSADTRSRLLWKSVKAVIQEKDLQHIHKNVQHYITMLTLQINVSGYNSLHPQSLSSALHRIEDGVTTLTESVSHCTSDLNRVGLPAAQRDEIALHRNGGITCSASGLNTTMNRGFQSLRHDHQSVQRETSDALDSITNRLQALEAMSAKQFDMFCLLFDLLRSGISIKDRNEHFSLFQQSSHEHTPAPRTPQNSTESPDFIRTLRASKISSRDSNVQGNPPRYGCLDLDSAAPNLRPILDNLYYLATSKRIAVYTEDADAIIHEIEYLLAVTLASHGSEPTPYPSRRQQEPASVLPLKKIRRTQILVGQADGQLEHRKVQPSLKSSRQRKPFAFTHQSFQTRWGTIAVSTKQERLEEEYCVGGRGPRSIANGFVEIRYGSLLYSPNNTQHIKVYVAFQQTTYTSHFFSFNYSLPACTTPPDRSHLKHAFRLVVDGNLNQLTRLLSARMVSIHDYDEEHCSLLVLAFLHAQQDIVRFLLDCGAAVDLGYVIPEVVSYLVSRKVEAAGQEREIYQRTWDVCICRLMKVDEDICGELESIHASNPEIAKLAWKAGPLHRMNTYLTRMLELEETVSRRRSLLLNAVFFGNLILEVAKAILEYGFPQSVEGVREDWELHTAFFGSVGTSRQDLENIIAGPLAGAPPFSVIPDYRRMFHLGFEQVTARLRIDVGRLTAGKELWCAGVTHSGFDCGAVLDRIALRRSHVVEEQAKQIRDALTACHLESHYHGPYPPHAETTTDSIKLWSDLTSVAEDITIPETIPRGLGLAEQDLIMLEAEANVWKF